MNFKSIFNKKTLSTPGQRQCKESLSATSLTNPYVTGAAGRKEWNDRYMNMAYSMRNWQFAFLISIVVCIILAFVIAKIATESHVEPFVVETNSGMPYAIQSMNGISVNDQRIVNFAINQFIENTLLVVSDPDAKLFYLKKYMLFLQIIL